MSTNVDYLVNLSFEEISIPPFKDILVLGKSCPQGKLGITHCYQMLCVDEFSIIEMDDEVVGYVLINNKILKRMSKEQIMEILKINVFPYMSNGETIKVNFRVEIFVKNIRKSK